MCLIYFAINKHPEFRFIALANRDEFYNRATKPAGFWVEHPDIIGGQDAAVTIKNQLPGTWLGMTKAGKVSFVTNYRDLKNIKTDAPSRGQLVTSFLSSDNQPQEYLNKVAEHAHLYNGFNLVTGIENEFYYYSNIQKKIIKLNAGIYGVSNHLINTAWPKLIKGKNLFEHKLSSGLELNPTELLDLMTNEEIAADSDLPDTGIGIEKERMLSAMFIKSANYGTRNTTLIMIQNSGHVNFMERTYLNDRQKYQTLKFEFRIDG